MDTNISPKKKNWLWIILIIILLIIIVGAYLSWKFFFLSKTKEPISSPVSTTKNDLVSWQEKGVAIAGTYADAEVVDLENGKYRMYYSIEPEVPNNHLEIYSALSNDGINWAKEEGTRKEFATFADVVKLPDGKWRMYFQNAGEIKSAISSDGLAWQDEPGVRINKAETGFSLDNVGAQSTTILPNGRFIMVYRGMIDEPYQTTQKIPNKYTDLYFWATSKDGLTFKKEGLAIDSRNDNFYGMTDGAEWVKWDNQELRVYFWSYAGVYHVVYRNDNFSKPVFDFTNNKDKNVKFPPNPPGDPTLIKIKNTWYMFYGSHTQGIYYATLQ